ncbi:MlaD family protein [Tsukamurella sp. 8F]|uniref:MlaD family protein n=1 Tax=unclassified Tsukamurella TaxID=2633480 RepID=UPI0023B9908E|nr:MULTISPECIES: MlaD family protein [unclassified Tsukamurella]MDF0530303.1 MlaD family protein [Tsukamurella sp. 8J]MDF0587600.1 MlaD family protein [Tsukamurella sp. 8F]
MRTVFSDRTRRGFTRRAAGVVAAAVVAAMGLTGCSSHFNPSSIPAPGQSGGGSGYVVHLDFPSVLNLPDKARVVVNGVPSGRLQAVNLKDGKAILDVKLQNGVKVPTTSTATLQQDTILGDVYVAIKAPTTGYDNLLRAGSTVPMSQTKAPTQIEDLLVDLSNFLGSGSLIQVQDTFKRVNDNLPEDPKKLQALIKTVSTTVVDLGKQNDELAQAIQSAGSLVDTVHDHSDTVASLFAPGGDVWLKNTLDVTAGALAILSRVSNAVAPLTFAEPLLENTTAVVATVLKPLMFPGWPNMNGRAANLANLQDLLQNKFIPFVKSGARVNLKNVGVGNQVPNEVVAQQMVKTLRQFGAVP